MEGVILKGAPDGQILGEALDRLRRARQAVSPPPKLLEFPFSGHSQRSLKPLQVSIQLHPEAGQFEIRISTTGLYNGKRLIGHFILQGKARKPKYEMTIG